MQDLRTHDYEYHIRRARQMRAEAMANGARAFAGWVRAQFVRAPKAARQGA